MRFKHEFAAWRPSELSAQVQPMIVVPRHGSYPMGHGCETYLAALVLAELVRDPAGGNQPFFLATQQQLLALADRIAWNRIIAGVHYPADLYAGQALGRWLAEYLLASCIGSARVEVTTSTFTPPASGVQPNPMAAPPAITVPDPASGSTTAVTLPPHDALKALFAAAKLEWARFETPTTDGE
jgi:hypothetical protein